MKNEKILIALNLIILILKIAFLILIAFFIFTIGGNKMSETVYGYCGSKGKHPIYTQKQVDEKFQTLENNLENNFYTKDNYYIAEGEITVPAMSTADDIVYLPDGWNNDNTII